ncbi:uncharacterized protein LOC126788715 [Argentina anserina]|uniref:uncharacterized protein LOC126788715 n=1 Tax=Argentina anserina TaxID=57926 RepID=UPI0021763270|nr:uncharacterized protein LOC126788715 [Potentilla anserina]
MADIGGDGMPLEGMELYKQQFKQIFNTHLARILTFDPNSVVSEKGVREILHGLTAAAFGKGVIYNGGFIPRADYNMNEALEYLEFKEYPNARIGGERCFMQLLRECHDEAVRRELDNIVAQAALIGEAASKVLIQMMVVLNIEDRRELVEPFSDTLKMLSFLVDAFDWPGKSAYFGVVFNRIMVLMKQAHREFILQVTKRIRMPIYSLGYIEQLELNIGINEDYVPFVHRILGWTVRIVSKLESYLSFALLPNGDGPRLLETDTRSVGWLLKELQHLGDESMALFTMRAEVLFSTYKQHEYFNDIEPFLNRMYALANVLWKDLLSEVQVVNRPLFQGRVRLHVEGKIMKLYPKSTLIGIVGINSRKEAEWYTGKPVAYRYKNNVQKKISHYCCIWGKIIRPHGDFGILYAKFRSHLVPATIVRLRVYIGVK